MLFIVSGASGVGKSTLCRKLRAEFSQIVLSTSVTTRAPREGEVHGEHYIFVTREEFQARVDAGDFAEWAEVHGNMYGSLRTVIDAELNKGNSVIFDIDYQGAEQLVAAYPNDAVTTMVLPPSWQVLEKRLRGRGTDSDEVIEERLVNARDEIAQADAFRYLVVNDDLRGAEDTLRGIFLAERAACSRVWGRVKSRYSDE